MLVESSNIQDAEFGAGYTVKEYHSTKKVDGDQGSHASIILKPLSRDKNYQAIELMDDELQSLKVVGIFERVLGELIF